MGGDPLETLNDTVDFERFFRPILELAAGFPCSPKGGRTTLDVVLKFRMLVLQSPHGLSLDATERMIRDRFSWMRFCGLGIADTAPDANTPWDFREALISTLTSSLIAVRKLRKKMSLLAGKSSREAKA